jgi:hypothetical protein
MKSNAAFIMSVALLATLVAPAPARIDGDEGGTSAYPRFRYERGLMEDVCITADLLINRPIHHC